MELAGRLSTLRAKHLTRGLLGRVSSRLRPAHPSADSREDQLREITDRLLSSREQLRQVLDTTQEAFISMNAEGRIAGWNRAAEATFGWPFSLAIGKPVAELIVPERFRAAHTAGLAQFRPATIRCSTGAWSSRRYTGRP